MKTFGSLPMLLDHILVHYCSSCAFNYYEKGVLRHISTEEFTSKIRRFSLGLQHVGLKPGETVGILANPSPFWLIADFAILAAGGISVPFYSHLSEETFHYQVVDSQMRFLFIIGDGPWKDFRHLYTPFHSVFTMDATHKAPNVIDSNNLMVAGDALSEKQPDLYHSIIHSLKRNNVATIIYTSGTTGIPKGVELTHDNILSQIEGAPARFPLSPRKDRALSILPLAHIFERMLMYYYISAGVNIYFVDDIKRFAAILKEVKPTIIAMVPRLLEKIQERIQSGILGSKGIQRLIGKWAIGLASEKESSLLSRLQRPLADALVYSRLRDNLGGNLKCIIVGGAPLDPILARFFLNVGIPVYQGYGLTESSPVIATNFAGHNKLGTVGIPFPGVEVSITEQGEIIARGPNIMKGYHGSHSQETGVHIDSNGWLHTGDLGSIDTEGYLSIVGRLRDIYKTSGGKYVSPLPIEQKLCRAPLIEMAMVVGEGREYATCLLFPSSDILQQLKKSRECESMSDTDFLESDFVKKLMQDMLKKINSSINKWEAVRKYRFILTPPSIENGQLTPTMKLRRRVIEKHYKNEIDAMYGEAK